MRIVKEAEERKKEILDAAEDLFINKGFDKTSTNDILGKVGIAKGTLYYHFKSKEDIMDAVINRYNETILARARVIAADKGIGVLERIVQVVLSLNVKNNHGEQLMEHMHKPQNALMHRKIEKMFIRGVTPILADIIREGIEKGMFQTNYPYECMEMIIVYANTVFDGDMLELTEEESMTRIQALIFHIERMLGVKEGSFITMTRMFGNN